MANEGLDVDGLNVNGIIRSLLDNPQMVQSIMGLLGGMNDNASQSEELKNEQNDGTINPQSLLSFVQSSGLGQNDHHGDRKPSHCHNTADRKTLLLALKPFLGKERQERIDFILGLLSLLDVAQSLGFINFNTK